VQAQKAAVVQAYEKLMVAIDAVDEIDKHPA
jgi:hypothetical protein